MKFLSSLILIGFYFFGTLFEKGFIREIFACLVVEILKRCSRSKEGEPGGNT